MSVKVSIVTVTKAIERFNQAPSAFITTTEKLLAKRLRWASVAALPPGYNNGLQLDDYSSYKAFHDVTMDLSTVEAAFIGKWISLSDSELQQDNQWQPFVELDFLENDL